MTSRLRIRLTSIGLPALVFAIFLVVWQVATSALRIPQYILPSPADLVSAFDRVSKTFPYDLWVTSIEAASGFALGSVGGFLLALCFARYAMVEKSLMPYVIAMKTVPIVAIAPLLVIWLGAGLMPKIILSALICFFPVLISTVKGLKEVDPDQIDLFRSLAATDWQLFKWLRFPSCMVYLFPSLRISIVFAVIGAIVAEFASANAGLGFKIMLASFHVDTSAMFVYIIACALLSLILYGIVAFAERFAVPWSYSERTRGDL
ncbi:MAG: ABC transporter permease [Planctomycetes bacterium]|nr:ABC transporter permease [Planctomycetota bacterium]NOG53321.1 ABC transporter permease [Planctomycetota bacterium]